MSPAFLRLARLTQHTLGLLLLLSTLPGCKLFEKITSSDTPEAPKSCTHDLQTVDAAKYDLEGDLPIKVKAALKGTVHLKELSLKLDREVADTCLSLARELDAAPVNVAATLPPGEHAKAACEQAARRIKAAREAGGVVLLLYPQAPVCSFSLDEYTQCAGQCDLTMQSFSTGMSCDPETALGRCDAQCTGSCYEISSENCKGSCRGTCKGGCDQDFYGKCGGRCIGTCDGSTSSGKCKGTCEGKCSSDAEGSCQGKCTGACQGTCVAESKKAKCAGTCGGSCTKPFSGTRCGSVLTPAEMVPECGALCDSKLAREVTCQGANVSILVYSSAKEGAGERLKNSLSRRLEVLLTAEEGMKVPTDRAHAGVTAAHSSVQEALSGAAKAEQISSCLQTASEELQAAHAALQAVREASAAVFHAIKN